MAGVKVTDLTTLGAADATDVMYIVDTSANQSNQDSSPFGKERLDLNSKISYW